MTTRWLPGLFLFLIVYFLSAFHGPWLPALISLILLILLCLVIRPWIRILFPDPTDSLILSFPVGYTLHALFLSFAGLFLGMYRITVILYVLAVLIYGLFVYIRMNKSEAKSDWTSTDRFLLWLWLFVTIAIVALPFARVAEQTSQGFAYRAYFNADFFRNMAVSGALSTSGIPPDNPYLSGNTLHYYWFFHLIPAFWNQLLPGFRGDFLLVQFSLVALLMFVATLFVTIRRFVKNSKTLLFLLPILAFGGSYEALYVLHYLKQRNLPWIEFVNLNVDGIFRWSWKAPQIDTLYRALLYAPQHLISLCILLIALLIWNSQRLGQKPLEGVSRKILFYSLIFATLGFSAFIGSALILVAALVALVSTIQQPRENWKELLLSGALGLIFLYAYLSLFEMFQGGSQQFDLGPDKIILAHFFPYFFLNWGALLILGLAGIFYRSPSLPNRILILILFSCFVLIFFVRIVLAGFSDISLKIGHFANVILLLLSAGAIDRFLSHHPGKSRLLSLAAFILVLPGILTWGMDAWNSQDIQNKRFTTYLRPEEAEVCAWMNQNLPPRAVVMNYSPRYEDFMRDIIPPFGERSVYVGNRIFSRIFQVEETMVQNRNRVVSSIFRETDPLQTWNLARNAGIQYIFVSGVELSKVLGKFSSPHFSVLIQDNNAALFRVNSPER